MSKVVCFIKCFHCQVCLGITKIVKSTGFFSAGLFRCLTPHRNYDWSRKTGFTVGSIL